MGSFVNMPFKERWDTEVARLREMTFKGKLQHIWEYYKLHLMAFAVILIIIGSLINIWLINPRQKTVLFIAWNAGIAVHEQLSAAADILAEGIVENQKRETVEVSLFFAPEGDPQSEMANTMRLTAMVAAGAIDVFILDNDLLVEYTERGLIQPVEEILSGLRTADPVIYAEVDERLAYVLHTSEEKNPEGRLMGVSISNSPLLSELGFDEEELWFCVSASSDNLGNIVPALAILLGSAA